MVERFEHENHIARLATWLALHKIALPDRRLFSDFGLVVSGIAIGFLFKTNSKQAYIDHVAADPRATREDRNAALNILVSELAKEAKKDGFLMMTALASLPTMKRRFEDFGFSKHGEFSLYYKVLGE